MFNSFTSSTIRWALSATISLTTASLLTPAFAANDPDPNNSAGDSYSNPSLRPEILPGSQTRLPQAPEEVQGTTTTLSGSASLSSLSCAAEFMDHSPLSRYRGDKLVFMKVHFQNKGEKPVLLLGKDVRIESKSGSGEVKTIGAATLEKHDNTLLTPKEKALVGLVGVGSAGLASSLFYEAMTPSENRKRDLGIALGRDRGRHEVETENLGTRYILPGDETHGWIAFHDSDLALSSNSLKVPIMFAPYDAVAGTLTVPVNGVKSSPTPDKSTRSR